MSDVMVETLWPTRGNGMLLGPDKVGKSYYAFEEALCLVMQWKVLGRYAVPKPRRVLFIEEEDDRPRTMRRLSDLIGLHDVDGEYLFDPARLVDDLAKDGRLTFWVKQGFRLTADVEDVDRFVRDQGIDVVYLDALSKVAGYRIERTEDAGATLDAFARVEQAGAVLRVVHHTSKGGGRFGDTRTARDGAGSYSIPAWNRAALLFSRRAGKVISRTEEGAETAESRSIISFEGTDGMSGKVCVMVQQHFTGPRESHLSALTAEDVEASGRLEQALLAKVDAILRDPATPRFTDPHTGRQGVTTLTLAELAGFGRDAAGKKKARRYVEALVETKRAREVLPPVGAGFARGVQLWEGVTAPSGIDYST